MTTLGVLSLSNKGKYFGQNPDFGTSMIDPSRYDESVEILTKAVKGAWASNVVSGDPACEDGYVKAAQELVAEGADAITCDCGFTVRYQQAIAAAVSVPVATSSLLLLPTLLSNIPSHKKIAVLTADSRCLDAGIMTTLGIEDPSRLVVEGLEGTATYDYMWLEKGEIDVNQVLADADEIIARVQKHEDIAAILCECTIFPRVSHRIRRATGLPVYDTTTNITLLMAGIS